MSQIIKDAREMLGAYRNTANNRVIPSQYPPNNRVIFVGPPAREKRRVISLPTTKKKIMETPSDTIIVACSAAQHRAALDVELFAQGARALAQARESRPKNTNKSYEPKQKEWRVSSLPTLEEGAEILLARHTRARVLYS